MSVTISTLANGMTIATDQMRDVETVSLGFWVGVGGRDETMETNGVAHFCEHMVFKGTQQRSAKDIAEEIDNLGGQMNAYTGREQTGFYVKLMAKDAAVGVEVLADMLQNYRLDLGDLEKERSVILQEIGESIDTPDDIVFDHLQKIAYPDQSLGRPILGDSESVKNLLVADLNGWLDTHYQPQKLFAVAAGNINHAQFTKMVEQNFIATKSPVTNPSLPNNSVNPPQFHGDFFHEHRDQIEQTHIVAGFPTVSAQHPDYYGYSLYSVILGGGMSSRLFQQVREERGLVYSISSFSTNYRETGLMGFYAGTAPESLKELVPVVAQELLKMTEDITTAELDRAKAQLRASLLMSRETTGFRADHLAQQLLTYGVNKTVAETLDLINQVTVADIHRIAAKIVLSPVSIATVGAAMDDFNPATALRRVLGQSH